MTSYDADLCQVVGNPPTGSFQPRCSWQAAALT